jgi:hypothetical protein
MAKSRLFVGLSLLAVLTAAVGCGSGTTSNADVASAAKEMAAKSAGTPSGPPIQTFGGGGAMTAKKPGSK